ncbi:MAG: 3-hydroxyacyl-[acyl-carrier-protein] dehydratase [Sulfurimonas sp.]|jgi:3-hydroxyacyl-[acyl-carrier-protein] dehydratase
MMHKQLYNIDFKDDNTAIITLCDENHPIFKAHFPSQPILPGFIHFEIISDIFELDITTIKKAKFTKVISPSQTIKYEKNNNKFKVFCQDAEVASFSL